MGAILVAEGAPDIRETPRSASVKCRNDSLTKVGRDLSRPTFFFPGFQGPSLEVR